jgi:hypothetical protein
MVDAETCESIDGYWLEEMRMPGPNSTVRSKGEGTCAMIEVILLRSTRFSHSICKKRSSSLSARLALSRKCLYVGCF